MLAGVGVALGQRSPPAIKGRLGQLVAAAVGADGQTTDEPTFEVGVARNAPCPDHEIDRQTYEIPPEHGSGETCSEHTRRCNSGFYRTLTNILPNGEVLALGGEYSNDPDPNLKNGGDTPTGEIFDPIANTWTNITNFNTTGNKMFGDDPTEVLPNGQVIAGLINGPQTYIYDPASNSWTQTGTKLHSDQSDEESWVKLPDGSILSYDVFASMSGTFQAQRYVPSQNQWVDASNLNPLHPPSILSDPSTAPNGGEGAELGPAFLRPDGKVIFFGANGKTAIYDPVANQWSAGPMEPILSGVQLVATDDPGAAMPNGDILISLSPLGMTPMNGSYNFPMPSYIYEYNPVAQTFTNVTPSGFNLNLNAYKTSMLVLPTGQVLMSNDSGQLDVYTTFGSPNPSWQPTISSVSNNGNSTFTLTGTQLNGISEGAAYGDDVEMASNYPIIQLQDSAGQVRQLYYARTYDWSSTGVATGGAEEWVNFALPAAFPLGTYTLYAIANGISSAGQSFTVSQLQTTTSLASSANPSVNGQVVTFTATVTAQLPVAGTPTGTVQLVVDGNNWGPPVVLSGGTATSTGIALTTGSHTVTANYVNSDGSFFNSSGSLAGIFLGQQVNAVTSSNLQSVIAQSLQLGNPIILQADPTRPGSLATILDAVSGLQPLGTPITLTVDLEGGTYTDQTASLPSNVTLVIQNGTLVGASPALTVTSGQVELRNCILSTATDAPTVLVTGGSLSLRDDTIEESTGGTDPAIDLTGGALDLGTTASPGGNLLNVNGAGEFVQNTTANLVPAVGDTFSINGSPQAAPYLSFTALSSSVVSSTSGQNVVFTATVTPDTTGSVAPSGSVDFFDTMTNTDLGTVPLSGGVASLMTSILAVGNHAILATYSGDSNYLSSIDFLPQPMYGVDLTNGVLTISQANPGNDNLNFSLSGGNYTFTDTGGLTFGTPTGNGAGFVNGGLSNTITIPSADVTSIAVGLSTGTNVFNFTGSDAAIAPIIVNTGSTSSDQVNITAAVTERGTISLTTGGTITETGGGAILGNTGTLTTSSGTGTTLNNVNNAVSSFNATNSTSGNVSLTNSTTLTVAEISQAGSGAVTVANTGALTVSGAVSGSGGGAISLTASGAVNLNANVSATGSGTIGVTASTNIAINGATTTVSTAGGNLTLSANQQTTVTTGNFVGINVNAATVQSATGKVLLQGAGGNNSGGDQYGVEIQGGGKVQTTGGTGTVTLQGTGGASSGGGNNYGVFVTGSGSVVTSGGGNVQVTGTSAGTGTGEENFGVLVGTSVTLTAGGSGAVTVNGTGGASSGNFDDGVDVRGTVTSSGGNVSVTGTGGGSGSGGSNYGVEVDGTVTAGGSGTVTVNGTGGVSSGIGVIVFGTVTSGGGNVLVTGTCVGSGYGVYVTGALKAGGSGTVTVQGTGGVSSASDNIGIEVASGGTLTSSGGNVSVTGMGGGTGSGGHNFGVEVQGMLTSGGSGTVTVQGTGGATSGGANIGVIVHVTGAMLTSSGGNISVTGTGGGTGSNDFGIDVENGAAVTATGSATLTLTGTGAPTANTAAVTASGAMSGTGGALTTGSGNLTLIGNVIDLGAANSVSTTGSAQLFFQPLTASRPIILGGSDASGSLVFSTTDQAAIANGFGLITVGSATGPGPLPWPAT